MRASWFTDHVTPHDVHRHQFKKILLRAKTPFQNVVLADTYSLGRCLILNNELQSAEWDEFIYHEALVHPAMAAHSAPRDILILGGGEGATVREILRYPSVRRVTMVDIDQDVVAFCRKYLSAWHQGALDDDKLNLIIADAGKYIAQTSGQFDIIFSDLPTPVPGELIETLYTLDFYRAVKSRLKKNGFLVVQSGSGNLLQMACHKDIRRKLQKLFPVARPYYGYVPSFDEPWSFVIASRAADPKKTSAARVDKKLGTISKALRFYDGETHEGLFRIPKYYRVT